MLIGLNSSLVLVFVRFCQCSPTFDFFFQFGPNIGNFFSIWSFSLTPLNS